MDVKIFHLVNGAKEASGITVIIDVFRAFTVECFLAANGSEKIIPVGDKDTAYNMKESDKNIILIGEREGIKLPGFDFGNSPSEIKNVDFTNKTAVHTTSAGTQGVANAKNAEEILVASLVNARATAEYILNSGYTVVSLVAMGLSGKEKTDEDELCAEYIKSILVGNEIQSEEIKRRINDLKYTSGAKFFDEANASVFPKEDFYLSTKLNLFDFALKVIKDNETGLNRTVKI